MYKEISAKIGFPGRISKEFKLGILVSEKVLELQLTDKISLVVEKAELLTLLKPKQIQINKDKELKDTEIP